MNITRRQISFSSSTEGPRHDPYHVQIVKVYINDDVIIVRMGSLTGCSLSRGKHTITEDVYEGNRMKHLEIMFEEMTGMPLHMVETYYYRWLERNPEVAEMMRIDAEMLRYAF